jgi:hypothetical protein
MPRKLPPKIDEKPQFERFIEAAKKAEAAETDEGLINTIRRVATAKHPASPCRRAAK